MSNWGINEEPNETQPSEAQPRPGEVTVENDNELWDSLTPNQKLMVTTRVLLHMAHAGEDDFTMRGEGGTAKSIEMRVRLELKEDDES